jgi:hypothetical protein
MLSCLKNSQKSSYEKNIDISNHSISLICFNNSEAAETSPAASAFLSGGRAVPAAGRRRCFVIRGGVLQYHPASIAGAENFTLGLD